MSIIFHITTREAWERARPAGTYRPEAFAAEGFIHCSTPAQVVRVAAARFRGRRGLVLLAIDAGRVAPDIVYENLEGGPELFPHIYGGLNADAVAEVLGFEPGADGYFTLPPYKGGEP
ncbi:MAG: DUF952 domain-containing protein [Acidobacteria bacterium]|nr:DUF952 domain-containing protein [Acidobacteriota bacterium]